MKASTCVVRRMQLFLRRLYRERPFCFGEETVKARCQLLCECCCGAHRFACDMYSRLCIHNHSFTHSFIHSFILSLMYAFTHPLTHSRTVSLHLTHSLTSRTLSLHFLTHSLILLLTPHSFIHSLTHSLIHSLIHLLTSPHLHFTLFTHSLITH